MADEIDRANEMADEHLARGIAAEKAPLLPGAPGECEGCDIDMPRLVDGLCGYCRDGRENPRWKIYD